MIDYIILGIGIATFVAVITLGCKFISDQNERQERYYETLNFIYDTEGRLKKAIDEVQKTIDAYEDLINKLDNEINNLIAQ